MFWLFSGTPAPASEHVFRFGCEGSPEYGYQSVPLRRATFYNIDFRHQLSSFYCTFKEASQLFLRAQKAPVRE